MFIDIQDPALDTAMDELVAAQPSGTSRRALARAILERVTAAFTVSRDPLAWMKIGPPAGGPIDVNQEPSPSSPPAEVPKAKAS